MTFFDTRGDGTYSAKNRITDRHRSPYPDDDDWWFFPEFDKTIRLGHCFPKLGQATESFDLSEAFAVRREDLAHDRRGSAVRVRRKRVDAVGRLSLAAARLALKTLHIMNAAKRRSGLSNKEIAAKLGLSAGRVSQVLNGDGNLHVATIARFLVHVIMSSRL
jgi:hypothetical protein